MIAKQCILDVLANLLIFLTSWVHMLLLGAVVLRYTNWDDEARKAQQRMNSNLVQGADATDRVSI
jgi:hypothetical protein